MKKRHPAKHKGARIKRSPMKKEAPHKTQRVSFYKTSDEKRGTSQTHKRAYFKRPPMKKEAPRKTHRGSF
jgi:hypothetical protein